MVFSLTKLNYVNDGMNAAYTNESTRKWLGSGRPKEQLTQPCLAKQRKKLINTRHSSIYVHIPVHSGCDPDQVRPGRHSLIRDPVNSYPDWQVNVKTLPTRRLAPERIPF